MASKIITPDMLAETIKSTVKDFEDHICTGVAETTLNVAYAGAQAVNTMAASQGFHGRKYKRSWHVKTQNMSRVHARAVICSTQYRVAHLLEKDHPVGWRGAWYSGRPHIAPVDEVIAKEYVEECEKIIMTY